MDTDSTKWLKLKSGSDVRARTELLNDEVCLRIGYAFAGMLAEALNTTTDRLTIAVGCDTRPHGQTLKRALIRGLTAADADVIDGGVCAMPSLFMNVMGFDNAQGAVMVTGGYAPEDMNGFKFLTGQGGFDQVAELLRRAEATSVPERLVTPVDVMAQYRQCLMDRARVLLKDEALKPLLGLYAAVGTDTLSGRFFADLLEALGTDVERIADSAVPETVVNCEADMGFSFDMDGGRASLVDPRGLPVNDNRLIALVAAMLLNERPGLTIVTDSVTSTGLTAFIQEWGGVHYRFKRGYRNVIREATRLNEEGIDCPLAIETTGHAAFRDNGFLMDGIDLALRIACAQLDCKREGKTVFDPLVDLREAVESRTLRLGITDEEDPAAACQEVVEVILSHTLVNPEWRMAPDSREGVRITFNLDGGVDNAWFQLRMSVHDPVMVLHAESDVPGGVDRVLGALYDLIGETELLDLSPLRAQKERSHEQSGI